MRAIFEVAVLLYMLAMIGQAEQDGFRDGLSICGVTHEQRL
jgi:hypothetical protein